MNNWKKWGWTPTEDSLWEEIPQDFIPARVTARFTSHWRVVNPVDGTEQLAELAGAFHYLAAGPEDFPATGDWVALSPEGKLIQRVLPRRTAITRQEAGRAARGQILAANIDLIFLVFGLDGGRSFSPGLLERFLTLSAASGADPVIVLNKADCAPPGYREKVLSQTEALAPGIPRFVTSALNAEGLDALRALVKPELTACCLGHSGVGKSSIINALLGENRLSTNEINQRLSKGRHTTTNAQLMRLPQGEGLPEGGLLMDTPGLRELQLWGSQEDLLDSFGDIKELAEECRFKDCRHQGEPGCAVQAAVAEGSLPSQRLEHFLEQREELAVAELRHSMSAQAYEKQKWKKIAQGARRFFRE